jgi:hypothetical protein
VCAREEGRQAEKRGEQAEETVEEREQGAQGEKEEALIASVRTERVGDCAHMRKQGGGASVSP